METIAKLKSRSGEIPQLRYSRLPLRRATKWTEPGTGGRRRKNFLISQSSLMAPPIGDTPQQWCPRCLNVLRARREATALATEHRPGHRRCHL